MLPDNKNIVYKPVPYSWFYYLGFILFYSWFYYDIFIIWKHSLNELLFFLDKINKFDVNIKFTLEIEKDGSLPFLDVILIKNNENLNIDRNVHRKPIRSNNTIPYNTSLPFLYKIAAYKFYIRRAFKEYSEKYLEKELNTIRDIAEENGFSRILINKLIYEFNFHDNIKKENLIRRALRELVNILLN